MDEAVVDLAAADLAGRGTDLDVLERASRHHLLDLLDVPGAGVFAPLSLQERLAVLERRFDPGRVEEAFVEPQPEVEPTTAVEPAPIEAGPAPHEGSDGTYISPLIVTLDALRSEVVALREVIEALRAELAEFVPLPETEDAPATPPTSPPAPGPAPADDPPPVLLPAALAEPAHPRPTTRRRRRGLYVVLLLLLMVVVGLVLAGGIILALAMGGSMLPRAWPALPPEVPLVF